MTIQVFLQWPCIIYHVDRNTCSTCTKFCTSNTSYVLNAFKKKDTFNNNHDNQIVLLYMIQSCRSTCMRVCTRQEDKESSDTKYNKLSIITMITKSIIMFIFTDNPQLKDASLKATEKVEAASSEEDKCNKAERRLCKKPTLRSLKPWPLLK